jgi:DNA-binding CsgD family transcriptional regulator
VSIASAEESAELLGRIEECAVLDALLSDALRGESRVLVLRGDEGAGKSALVRYASAQAAGWRVASVVGVESEMELAFSGIHQLCSPLLGHLERLPEPQRMALEAVFGLEAGPTPDRFLVALSALALLAEAAEDQPLLCVVDDAHWLDAASAQVIGFVARRLLVERIVMVCAARPAVADDALAGLPELLVSGLSKSDSRTLLLANMAGPLDAAVCDQIVAESHGNPLALLELPRTWRVDELAGGFGLPGQSPLAGKIEQSYSRRLLALPAETQLLVLAAAAEPQGDPVLLRRATDGLGLEPGAADPALDAGLLKIGSRVEFAHPLVRTAAYRFAAAGDRERVHHALAEATDADSDPDRRAWHRARAISAPDEDVAGELERSAGRAQERGGLGAAAAFLQRAAALTVDPVRRVERALAAAQASLQAGAFDAALGLAATAETGAIDDVQRARVALVRAHVAFAAGQGRDAPPLLLEAARQLQPLDADLARETYLDAWGAALFAGSLASGGDLLEVSRAVKDLPPLSREPRAAEVLLDGLATLSADGHDVAAPTLRAAAHALEREGSVGVNLRWGWLAKVPAIVLWDDQQWIALAERHLALSREAGALARLPIDLTSVAHTLAWRGEFAAAASAIAEAGLVTEITRIEFAPRSAMQLAALRGREAEVRSLVEATIAFGSDKGQGNSVLWSEWVTALLFNGLARYEEARVAAEKVADADFDVILPGWALPELIEASVKTGKTELGRAAFERFARMTGTAGTDWALGVECRCGALLSEGGVAEELYRRAIDHLGRTQLRIELARAHLLYGEWLRSEERPLDARLELRTAFEMCTAIGMEAFAERARKELAATGENARKPTSEEPDDLTPQERQIARLARDGLSNPEIGAQLFISPRTVEWHLRKVFAKLGISSRRQLRTVMPPSESERLPVGAV